MAKESYPALLSPVSEDSDPEYDFEAKGNISTSRFGARFRKHGATVLHSAAWVLIVAILALIIVILKSRPTNQQCAAQLSLWSPLLEAVEYVNFDFDNAFDSTNIYRGPPTPELEFAWQNLTYKHAIDIPEDKIHLYNRSGANLKPAPPDVSTGYTAVVEVFHQLHCLNVVRQYTWLQAGKYDDPPGPLTLGEVGNRMHVDHCIETLRIALMCSSDITPLFILVDADAPVGSRADFNGHHRCRNFSKIEEWMDNNWTIS